MGLLPDSDLEVDEKDVVMDSDSDDIEYMGTGTWAPDPSIFQADGEDENDEE